MIGLIELHNNYILFARTVGAKDKKKRKRRNYLAEGSAVGAAGLAAANPRLKRQQSLLNKEKDFLQYKDFDTKRRLKDAYASIEWANSMEKEGVNLDNIMNKTNVKKKLEDELTRAKVRNARRNKKLQPRIAQNARELSLVKAGKKVSKYGAMGLAGVAGVELARRGIKKYRNRGKA